MPFIYSRTVHFQETDAAGVVYFANVLMFCHEAYEASLAAAGIELKLFFGKAPFAVPVVHASVDFRQPMFCGDRISIQLVPQQLDQYQFETAYQVFLADDRLAAGAIARHVCIDAVKRTRMPLPETLLHWLAVTAQA